MTLPSITSYSQVQNSGTTAGTFTISGIADGSWMVLSSQSGTAAITHTITTGWTALISNPVTMGSRGVYLWARIKQSGDTTVTITKSASSNASFELTWGDGADPVADWTVGTEKLRATSPAETTTTTGLSVTTAESDCLALAFNYEATTATEGSTPTVSGTGWSQVDYIAQIGTTNIEQQVIASKSQSTAGATGDQTVTWANSQASNGYGIQLILTPSVSASGATVTVPSAGAFTMAAPAPTVSGIRNANSVSVATALTMTAPAPTATTSGGRVVVAVVATLTLTAKVPSVSSATLLASGAYAFDRWKANAAGTSLTFTTSPQGQTVTINDSHGIQQVIERANMPAGDYVLSWSGTATARVYNFGGTAPSYAASPVLVTLDGAADVVVEFTASGGPKTVGLVQLEIGSTATSFEQVSLADELARCRRYFQTFPTNAVQVANPYFTTALTGGTQYISLPMMPMRATPTVRRADGTTGLHSFTYLATSAASSTTRNVTVSGGSSEHLDGSYASSDNSSTTLAAIYARGANVNPIWLDAEL